LNLKGNMGADTKVSDQPEVLSEDIGEKKDDKVAFATYQKVLSEKKKRDAEVSEYKAKLDAIEQEKLEVQGKHKEVIEAQRKALAEKDAKIKNMFQEFGTKTLKGSFDSEAKSLGCVNPEDLYKLVDLSAVEIGEDFSFNPDQLKSLITDAQKTRPYLFKKDVVHAKDATPGSGNKPTNFEVSKLGQQDLQKLLAMKLANK